MEEGIAYWKVGLGYAFIGAGVGFAGTPASHSLTGSVPVRAGRDGLGHGRPAARPRWGDHAVDPRRAADGGLRHGGREGASANAPNRARVTTSGRERADEVLRQRRGHVAKQYPRTPNAITAGRQEVLHRRRRLGVRRGIIAILLGGTLVFLRFPRAEEERRLLAAYAAEDADPAGEAAGAA